jgi:ketosteroid isomerase-like protein
MQAFLKQAYERHFDVSLRSGLLSGTSMSFRDQTRVAQLLAGALLFSFALVGVLQAQHHRPHGPKRAERKQVEQLEQQWQNAMLTDDVPMMDKLLSEDYLGVTAGGDLVTKTQQLERMRNRQLTVTKLDTTDVKVKLVGQIAIVTSLAQIEAVAEGRPVQGSFRTTRVYQRLPGAIWKLTNFTITKIAPGHGEAQALNGTPS